jgi:hypothetical protein
MPSPYPKNPDDLIGYCLHCQRKMRRRDVSETCVCGCRKAAPTLRVVEGLPADYCARCDQRDACAVEVQ